MCLLQETTHPSKRNTNAMSVVSSVCKSLSSDSLVRHFDAIRKAECEADSIKNKWTIKNRANRVVYNNQNKRNNYRSKFDGNKTKIDGDRKTFGNSSSAEVATSGVATVMPEGPASTPCAYRNGWKRKKRKSNHKRHRRHEDVVDACTDRLAGFDIVGDKCDVTSSSSGSNESLNYKKVHFDDDHLVQVIEFPDDEESEEMRKCYWETFAVDRYRFRDRIAQIENCLKPILTSDHRQRVYSQRFIPEVYD